ncbi:MAG: glycosyltransferase family 2 protein [Methylovirgula sp.]|uniref:glycosyltransferase family 2 protein n=1 Tax=Methylovirgula sp. TaxID=1978224 RepID=UPI0030767949
MENLHGGSVVYSIVIPIYNEEAVIPLLLHRLDALLDRLDGASEVIIVDDGSKDTGPIVLANKSKNDPRYRFVRLSRNFGHQIAITAGLDVACGQAVIVMDGDLQDPPEVIDTMIARWREGYEIVYAKRRRRDGETAFKRWTAKLFYSLMDRLCSVDIPPEVGDFRLVDRTVLDAFRAMREQDRFVRGMFAWLGFRQAIVEFERPPRAAGATKYPIWKMVRLAVAGVVGFSDVPLLLAIWAGGIVSFAGLAYGLYVVAVTMAGAQLAPGWASTIVIVTLLCGMNMLLTGIVGLYIARIYSEVKARPLYVVAETFGFNSSDKPVQHLDEFGSTSIGRSRSPSSEFPPNRKSMHGTVPLPSAARARNGSIEEDNAPSVELRRPA